MSLALAIKDLETTLNDLAWLKVIGENQEAGNRDYTITIGMGPAETDQHFGARKFRQIITLTLTIKGIKEQGKVAGYLDTLTQAIIEDRRRDGNAQTTLVGPWTPEEDEGREGLVYNCDVEVHYYAS